MRLHVLSSKDSQFTFSFGNGKCSVNQSSNKTIIMQLIYPFKSLKITVGFLFFLKTVNIFGQYETGFHLAKLSVHDGSWIFQNSHFDFAVRNNRILYFKGDIRRITIHYERKSIDYYGDTAIQTYSPCTYIFDHESKLIYAHTQNASFRFYGGTRNRIAWEETSSYRYEYFRNSEGKLIGYSKIDDDVSSIIYGGSKNFINFKKNSHNSIRDAYYFIDKNIRPVQIFDSIFNSDSIFKDMHIYERKNRYGGKSGVFSHSEESSDKFILEFDSDNLLRQSNWKGYVQKMDYKIDNFGNIIEVRILNVSDRSFDCLEKISYEIVYWN